MYYICYCLQTILQFSQNPRISFSITFIILLHDTIFRPYFIMLIFKYLWFSYFQFNIIGVILLGLLHNLDYKLYIGNT